jgi:hypothetical protein
MQLRGTGKSEGAVMRPENANQTRSGNADAAAREVIARGEDLLDHAKAISQQITERVRKLTGDATSHGAPSDTTDESQSA